MRPAGAVHEFRHDQMRAFLAALWLVEETPTLSALEKAATDAEAFALNRRDQEELWRFLAALLVSAEDLGRSGDLQTTNPRSVRSCLPRCRPRRTIVMSRLSAPRGDAGQRPRVPHRLRCDMRTAVPGAVPGSGFSDRQAPHPRDTPNNRVACAWDFVAERATARQKRRGRPPSPLPAMQARASSISGEWIRQLHQSPRGGLAVRASARDAATGTLIFRQQLLGLNHCLPTVPSLDPDRGSVRGRAPPGGRRDSFPRRCRSRPAMGPSALSSAKVGSGIR